MRLLSFAGCLLFFEKCMNNTIRVRNICNQIGSDVLSVLVCEHSGSVVECLTRNRGAAGSSVTALWSLSKTHLS